MRKRKKITKKTPRETTKKKIVKKPKTKALALKTSSSLAWGSVVSKDSQALQVFCKKVAEVYGVPPMGVNSIAGQPYLNKEGRLYLLNDIKRGKEGLKAIRTEFLQMSTSPDQASICKKTLVFKDGLEIEGIGEASQGSVKLDAVKKTLNMMAETRALNRAIWQAIGGQIWERVAANLQKSGVNDPDDQAKIAKAGTVSYEEIDVSSTPKSKEMSITEKFEKAQKMIGALKTRKAVKESMSMIASSEIYNQSQKDKLMEALLVRDNKLEIGTL